jgi:hypothetical protein
LLASDEGSESVSCEAVEVASCNSHFGVVVPKPEFPLLLMVSFDASDGPICVVDARVLVMKAPKADATLAETVLLLPKADAEYAEAEFDKPTAVAFFTVALLPKPNTEEL